MKELETDAVTKAATENSRQRAAAAYQFPKNTCPASRHLYLIAEILAQGAPAPALEDDRHHCANTMFSVLASLWELRTAHHTSVDIARLAKAAEDFTQAVKMFQAETGIGDNVTGS